ncbi:MAG: YdcF family protein [Lachnospiraceae bacterium]|nr:YdcF family protein [Lachnospiraceae bacterium]
MNMRVVQDISDYIFVEDQPEKADAILIPGGAYPELAELAAGLFREGYSDLVIPSGAYAITEGKFAGVKSKQDIYTGEYETECDFYCDVLDKNGVPEAHILREDKSQFTAQNAWFTRDLLQERGIEFKKAIICCKAFHARRCLMYYQFTFPDTEFIVVPAKDTHKGLVQKENWYTSEAGVEKVLGELNRIGTQFMPEFTGLRKSFEE